MTDVLTGRCFCGAIEYRAEGPFESSALCHCEHCRRSSGAPVVAWVEVGRDRLQWLRGKPRVYRHESDWPTPVTRSFCETCGTLLTYERDGSEFVDMTIASLDAPEKVRPHHHVYVSRQLDWLPIDDDLPRYDTHRPGAR